MSMYQGYRNDDQKIKILASLFLFFLLVGYFLNRHRSALDLEQGKLLREELGKRYEEFESKYGEPLYDDKMHYLKGKKHKRYRRFQNKKLEDTLLVTYVIWIESDSTYVGSCFTEDNDGYLVSRVVRRLTSQQLYNR